MAFKKRRINGLTAAAPQVIGTVGLGAKYARFLGYRARNWASSAKAAAGTDTAGRIELKDNNGDIFFLDAADEDYATAEVTRHVAYGDTLTGLNIETVDGTGTPFTATEGETLHGPIIESPVTVTARNFGTTTDFLEVDILVEI